MLVFFKGFHLYHKKKLNTGVFSNLETESSLFTLAIPPTCSKVIIITLTYLIPELILQFTYSFIHIPNIETKIFAPTHSHIHSYIHTYTHTYIHTNTSMLHHFVNFIFYNFQIFLRISLPKLIISPRGVCVRVYVCVCMY